MRSGLVLSCLWVCVIAFAARGTAAPADAPAARLVLELSDGSRVVGTPSIDRLKVTTKYAGLEIPLSMVRTVEFSAGNHAAQLKLVNGDVLTGGLAATEIELKTIFGQVVIPLAQVRRISAGPGGGALPEGLVLHYTFDADEDGKVTDASGCGNDGTVRGPAFTKEGKVSGAMSFNGRSQAIIVGNPASLRLQDFTIMAWIKRGSTEKVSVPAEDGQIFGYGDRGYIMGLHKDGKLFISKVNVGGVFSKCEIHDTDFHHVALVKKGGGIVFYLDGTAYPANDYNDNFEFNTDVAVGARSDHLDGSFLDGTFLGLIDEVEVFNRPLSDDEVKGVYESRK